MYRLEETYAAVADNPEAPENRWRLVSRHRLQERAEAQLHRHERGMHRCMGIICWYHKHRIVEEERS